MSLADRLSTIAPTTKCIVCLWYRTLAKDDRAAFDKVADHVPDVYSFAEFHRICALEGLECSESSFKRHMKIHREPR